MGKDSPAKSMGVKAYKVDKNENPGPGTYDQNNDAV